jgi:branched-chain amino acid transport system permease protein
MDARKLLTPSVFWLAVLGALLIAFPFMHEWPVTGRFIGDFRTFNATMFAVWFLVSMSMNLLTGSSGQISLGHAAVVLTGAYTTGIFFDQFSIPLALAVPLAGVFTGVVGGLLIGLPAVRLSGPYLAIATFSLIITMPQILKLNGIDELTNGALGIGIKQVGVPAFFDSFLDARQWLYYVTMATALFMAVLLWNLTHSRIGRAFVALRDSEIGAEQMGINVPLYKAMAFGISSFYAGIGGGLFFVAQTFVAPESLRFNDSILFLVAIVIGGLGSMLGSVFGALFLTFQVEVISNLPDWIPLLDRVRDFEQLNSVIYGALLIGTILLFPRGIAGITQRLLATARGGTSTGVPIIDSARGTVSDFWSSLTNRSGKNT